MIFFVWTWWIIDEYGKETYELFLRESMQTEQTDPQEIPNDQSTIFQEIEIRGE